MSANLESMFSRNKPWHDFANVTGKALNGADARIAGGIDWLVEKRPLYFQSMGITEKIGISYLPAFDAFSVVRLSDEKHLGVVGAQYNPIQNFETSDFSDALLQEGAEYETAGSLFEGKKIFFCAKLRTIDILGSETSEYLVVCNSHDGSSPFMAFITPICVVCSNTLRMAINGASRMVRLRHTKNVADRVDDARMVLSLAHKYTDKMKVEAERMFQIPFAGKLLDQFVDRVFGVPEDGDKELATRTKNLMETQEMAFGRALIAPDLENFRGTAWGVYQALADFDSHREVARDNPISKDRNFMRIIEGNNWLEDKTKMMLEMAGVE